MFRLVIVGLVIYVLYRLWKKAGSGHKVTRLQEHGVMSEMVACERCGTFILNSEVIYYNGHSYCSESCSKGS